MCGSDFINMRLQSTKKDVSSDKQKIVLQPTSADPGFLLVGFLMRCLVNAQKWSIFFLILVVMGGGGSPKPS